MHQLSVETICPLKAFQLHYRPDNNAKSMVKHFIFLHKFSVIRGFVRPAGLKKVTSGKDCGHLPPLKFQQNASFQLFFKKRKKVGQKPKSTRNGWKTSTKSSKYPKFHNSL